MVKYEETKKLYLIKRKQLRICLLTLNAVLKIFLLMFNLC